MIQTLKAVIDEHGAVRLLENVQLPAGSRALVTILEDEPAPLFEAALLSEAALEDWSRPQEETAWAYLQQGH